MNTHRLDMFIWRIFHLSYPLHLISSSAFSLFHLNPIINSFISLFYSVLCYNHFVPSIEENTKCKTITIPLTELGYSLFFNVYSKPGSHLPYTHLLYPSIYLSIYLSFYRGMLHHGPWVPDLFPMCCMVRTKKHYLVFTFQGL